MPREKENYRYELEQLLEFFSKDATGAATPTKRVLTVADVERYTGRERRWLQKTYGIDPKKGISVVALAQALS